MEEYSQRPAGAQPGVRASSLVNGVGAVVSLGLIVGVGVWGYNLVMRDVSGIPVVRAMEGPMRTAPENPGGDVAAHVGLAVNEVAAEGGAADPGDLLVLAPTEVQPLAEDLNVTPLAEAGEVTIEETDALETEVEVALSQIPTQDNPLTDEQILALADQIASGVQPLTDLADGVANEVSTAINGVPSEVIADIIPASVPGVSTSLRPVLRPESLAPVMVSAQEPTEELSSDALLTTQEIPIGTNLVQLGAYDSAEIAAAEWRRFNGRFTDFMSEKERVIQQASRGGRTFFRLRAMGFEDLSDARRFCAAMMAENVDCVPVVVR